MPEHNLDLAAYHVKCSGLKCGCVHRDAGNSRMRRSTSGVQQHQPTPCHCVRCCANTTCTTDHARVDGGVGGSTTKTIRCCMKTSVQRCWFEVALEQYPADDPNVHAREYIMDNVSNTTTNSIASTFTQSLKMRIKSPAAPPVRGPQNCTTNTLPFLESTNDTLRHLARAECQSRFVERSVMSMRVLKQGTLGWGSGSATTTTASKTSTESASTIVEHDPLHDSVECRLLDLIFPKSMLLEFVDKSTAARGYCVQKKDILADSQESAELEGMYVYYPCFPSYVKANTDGFNATHYLGHKDPRPITQMNPTERAAKILADQTELLDACHIGLLCRDAEYTKPLKQLREQGVSDAPTPPLDQLVYFYVDSKFKFHKATRNMVEVLLVAPVRRALVDVALPPHIMRNADPKIEEPTFTLPNLVAADACSDEDQRRYEALREKAGFGKTILRAENGCAVHVPLLPFWYAKSGARDWLSFLGNYRQEQNCCWGDAPNQFHQGHPCTERQLLQSLSAPPATCDTPHHTSVIPEPVAVQDTPPITTMSSPSSSSSSFVAQRSFDEVKGCYVHHRADDTWYRVAEQSLSQIAAAAEKELEAISTKKVQLEESIPKLEASGNEAILTKVKAALASLITRIEKSSVDLLGSYVKIHSMPPNDAIRKVPEEEMQEVLFDNSINRIAGHGAPDDDAMQVEQASDEPPAPKPRKLSAKKVANKKEEIRGKEKKAYKEHLTETVAMQDRLYQKQLAKHGDVRHKEVRKALKQLNIAQKALAKFEKDGVFKNKFIDDEGAEHVDDRHKYANSDEDSDYEEEEAEEDDDVSDPGDEEPEDGEDLSSELGSSEEDERLEDELVDSSDEAASGDSDDESEAEEREAEGGEDDEPIESVDDDDDERERFHGIEEKKSAPKRKLTEVQSDGEKKAANKRVRTTPTLTADTVGNGGIAAKFKPPRAVQPPKVQEVVDTPVKCRIETDAGPNLFDQLQDVVDELDNQMLTASKEQQQEQLLASSAVDEYSADNDDDDDDDKPKPGKIDPDAVTVERMPYTTSASSGLVQGSASTTASSAPQKSTKSKGGEKKTSVPSKPAPASVPAEDDTTTAKSKPKGRSTVKWTDADFALIGSSRAEYDAEEKNGRIRISRAITKAKEQDQKVEKAPEPEEKKDKEHKKHKKDKEHKKDKKDKKHKKDSQSASEASSEPAPKTPEVPPTKAAKASASAVDKPKPSHMFKKPSFKGRGLSVEDQLRAEQNLGPWSLKFETFMESLKPKYEKECKEMADRDYAFVSQHFEKTLPKDLLPGSVEHIKHLDNYDTMLIMFNKDGWTAKEEFGDFSTPPKEIKACMSFLKVIYYLDRKDVPPMYRQYTRKAILEAHKPEESDMVDDF